MNHQTRQLLKKRIYDFLTAEPIGKADNRAVIQIMEIDKTLLLNDPLNMHVGTGNIGWSNEYTLYLIKLPLDGREREYVGATSCPLDDRIKGHINKALKPSYPKTKLVLALRKVAGLELSPEEVAILTDTHYATA